MAISIKRICSAVTALAVLAGSLLLVAALTIAQGRQQIETAKRIHQTRHVLDGLSAIDLAVVRAESARRGVLLTGDADDPAILHDAGRTLPAAVAALGAMGDRNGMPVTGVAELRRLIDAETADPGATTGAGRRLTTRILARVGEIKGEQDRALAACTAAAARERRLMVILAILGGAIAALFVGFAFHALRTASRRTMASEERYRLLADNVNDLIVRFDLDLRRTYVSPSSVSLLGRDPAELIGGTPFDLAHPGDAPVLERQYRRLLEARGESELLTHRILHRDGHYLWVESALTLVRDAAGQPAGLISAIRDISSRKVQSDELRAVNLELERLARHLASARDRAEQANSAKTRFLAGMSHELRTPLNGLIGYAHLLRLDGGLSATQEARVSSMLAAGEHLLGMITHVLALSEIEAERVDLHCEAVDPASLGRACLALVQPASDDKHLDLRLSVDPDAPALISADPGRLRQVLVNLLGNAVKFTRTGWVELRLQPAGAERMRIEVADTGPGIPAEQAHRLFAEFDRLTATGTALEGAGLGLAISLRLVALMGGTVEYRPNEPAGSVFTVELPVGSAIAALPRLADRHIVSRRRLRILVAEDVAMNRDIAEAFLRAAGHEAVMVDGGVAAVQAAAGGWFDAVLMDVRMPDIDGLEAARRIRALPGPGSKVPIVALTAQAFSEQIAECRAAGMNGHLSKPFTPEALLLTIERAIAADEATQAGSPDHGVDIEALPVLDETIFRRTAACLDRQAVRNCLATIEARAVAFGSGLGSGEMGDTALASLAHEFAGSAGMFGFSGAAEAARRLERALEARSPDEMHWRDALGRILPATLTSIRAQPSALPGVELLDVIPGPTGA
jgi:PAS domain S-box-containing protein